MSAEAPRPLQGNTGATVEEVRLQHSDTLSPSKNGDWLRVFEVPVPLFFEGLLRWRGEKLVLTEVLERPAESSFVAPDRAEFVPPLRETAEKVSSKGHGVTGMSSVCFLRL